MATDYTSTLHDDCQVYVSVPVTVAAAAVDRFSRCVADVSTWLISSRLRLNPAKTVVIWLGGRQQVANIIVSNIPVLSSTVTTVASARDLLASLSIVSSPCLRTSAVRVHQRTISYISCGKLYVHCPSMLRRRLSSRSCQHAWTTATVSCMALLMD